MTILLCHKIEFVISQNIHGFSIQNHRCLSEKSFFGITTLILCYYKKKTWMGHITCLILRYHTIETWSRVLDITNRICDITNLICDSTKSILTSKRNASSKALHNVLHEHHTCSKGLSILNFGCISLNDILKIWFSLKKKSKLRWTHHLQGCIVRSWRTRFAINFVKAFKSGFTNKNSLKFETKQ